MLQTDPVRRTLLRSVGAGAAGVAALTAAGLALGGGGRRPGQALRSLPGTGEWLNTEPLHADQLVGKVVLVSFWTYTCINSLRPLPYVSTWANKYRDRGLVVLGVHAPEFGFEHDINRVRRAAAQQGIAFPVALDNDFAVWRAFENRAWPAFYFVDAEGMVRDRKWGEGDYVQSERTIQRLLSQARGEPIGDAVTEVIGEGAQAAPDWADLRSPETYLGYDKAEKFAGRDGFAIDAQAIYESVPGLPLNHWTLAGSWVVGREYATAALPDAAIKIRFHSRDLHLVLARNPAAPPVRYRVTIDGSAPGEHHGIDTDANGWGVIEDDRMYQLVRQKRPIEDRVFEVSFQEPGARAYVFTFG
jgi:thiol-disulfide isomerase/thioredoxin